MLRRLWLILHTVRYLRFKQIWFQIFYRIEKPKPLFAYDDQFESEKLTPLLFSEKPPVFVSVIDILGNGFSFLNLEKKFGTTIDWNEQSLGRLWNYNLQYCNFLLQDEIPYDIRITWLVDLYVNLYEGQVPIEPYPSSLRSINVIRLMTIHGVDEEILPYLHSELDFLEKHLEFHLLGNHLLENLFTLFMGGAFFDEVKWYNRAQKLLIEQLDEQILEDGGHFELSPMYHQIILFRLLELIDWYSTWRRKENGIEVYLKGKAESMLSWIKKMSFKNGNIPHFNDSAEGISYNTQWLLQYGLALGLNATVNLPLKQSGYRAFNFGDYECRVDLAEIGASYQPGHSHADALSFVLYKNEMPFLVEIGTSTYEMGERRNVERGSSAHNTVVVGNRDQSEVWSGFRVGNRAKVKVLKDMQDQIVAEHNGYKSIGLIHRRSFNFFENSIEITDELINSASCEGVAYFHFHPLITKEQIQASLFFENELGTTENSFEMADGYNRYKLGICLAVKFEKVLKTKIKF